MVFVVTTRNLPNYNSQNNWNEKKLFTYPESPLRLVNELYL